MELVATTWLFWLTAIVGVVLTGISKSGFAGGAGVVAVPLLALTIPVPVAVTLMLPLLIIMDARTVHYYRKSIEIKELQKIVPAAILGIVLGGLALGSLPTSALQISLGILCILFALWKTMTTKLGRMPGNAWIWGTASGTSSTLLHAGGPPINIYLIARNLPKETWLATASVFFAIMNLVKVVPYGLLGQWQMSLFIIVLMLAPFALLGVWLGKWLQTHMSEELFIQICRYLLLVSGVLLIIKSMIQ